MAQRGGCAYLQFHSSPIASLLLSPAHADELTISLAAHVLHDLVPAPKTLKIVGFFVDEVDVADERVANVEEEACLNLLLAGGAAVFVKLGGGVGGRRRGCNTDIEVHLSDDMELVRVQEGSAGAIPLLEGFDTLLREV
jgi:hypothetical protein